MSNRKASISKRLKLSWPVIFIGVISLIVVVMLLIWAIRPNFAPNWSGFGVRNDNGQTITRTLWDWLDMLLLPVAILVSAWWINRRKSNESQTLEEDASSLDKVTSIEDAEQEKRLQAYFDRLIELLLVRSLRESTEEDEVRLIARAQTLTTLWGLSGERKGTLTRFLYEARLIQHPDPIIPLANANLAQADLSRSNLSKADLKKAQLTRANLRKAQLSRADLTGADLEGADLRGAFGEEPNQQRVRWVPPNFSHSNLNEANLQEANLVKMDLTEASLKATSLEKADLCEAILRGANFEGAQINDANLNGANLRGTNLSKASLQGAQLNGAKCTAAIFKEANLSNAICVQANMKECDLSGAVLLNAQLNQAFLYKSNLRGANLKRANLQGANLSAADLTDAILEGANLKGAYLSAAKVTSEQLASTASTEDITMPNNDRMRIHVGGNGDSADSQDYYYQVANNNSES